MSDQLDIGKLRDDACNLDGKSLMDVLHAQQKYERAVLDAAPALLDAAEERDKYRTAANVLCAAHIGLPQASCPVCERDGLREKLAEAERVMESHGGAGAINYYRSDRDRAERATWAAKKTAEEVIRKNDALLAERDALRAELSWIDSVLARRPALDKPTRAANIEHAINVAKQADAIRGEVERLREALLTAARSAEALKQECSMDPESPQAIRNGRYMAISYAARAALRSEKGEVKP